MTDPTSPAAVPRAALALGPHAGAVEERVAALESRFQNGDHSSFADLLDGLEGEERRRCLVELAHVELELRLKAGEPVRVETLLARHPDLADDPADLRGLVEAEYRLRRRREPNLTSDEFARRFPGLGLSEPPTQTHRLSEPPAAAPAAPPAVPGYAVERELGRGGMGVVYLARQLRPPRPV